MIEIQWQIRANGKHQVWKAKGRVMDTNTGESPGHQSQSQKLGNSPSEEEMGHWTLTGVEPRDYDDDDDTRIYICMYVCMYVCTYVRTYLCMLGPSNTTASNTGLNNHLDKIHVHPFRRLPLFSFNSVLRSFLSTFTALRV